MSETSPIAQQHTPPEEILLGRYRVLARRGTGGFGTVCTCWDLRLQRRVNHLGHVLSSPQIVAVLCRAAWHCMLTATGSPAICVGICSI